MENRFERDLSQDALVSERLDIINNGLFGVYNNSGEYFIAQPIIDELILIEKAKKTVFKDSMFCESNIPGIGEIVFEVKINRDDETNIYSADLFLLESVYKINGYLENTIKTKIKTFSSEKENFIEKTYKEFNIIINYDENGRGKKVSIDDFLEKFIYSKHEYNRILNELSADKIDELYDKYLNNRKKILNKKNEFCDSINENFTNEYEKIKDKFLFENRSKDVNELLDKCVEDITQTKEEFKKLEVDYKKELMPALKEFKDSTNKVLNELEEKAISSLNKTERENLDKLKDEENTFLNKSYNKNKLSEMIDLLDIDSELNSDNVDKYFKDYSGLNYSEFNELSDINENNFEDDVKDSNNDSKNKINKKLYNLNKLKKLKKNIFKLDNKKQDKSKNINKEEESNFDSKNKNNEILNNQKNLNDLNKQQNDNEIDKILNNDLNNPTL